MVYHGTEGVVKPIKDRPGLEFQLYFSQDSQAVSLFLSFQSLLFLNSAYIVNLFSLLILLMCLFNMLIYVHLQLLSRLFQLISCSCLINCFHNIGSGFPNFCSQMFQLVVAIASSIIIAYVVITVSLIFGLNLYLIVYPISLRSVWIY